MTWVLLLWGCESVVLTDYGFTDEQYFEKEYQIINSDTDLKIISFEEFNDLKQSDINYIIALSRPTCPSCQTTIPRLVSVANESKVDVIYFLNTDKLTSSEKDTLASKYHVNTVPTIYFKGVNYPEMYLNGDSSIEVLRDKIIESRR